MEALDLRGKHQTLKFAPFQEMTVRWFKPANHKFSKHDSCSQLRVWGKPILLVLVLGNY